MKIVYLSHLHPKPESPLDNLGGMQRVSLQLTAALRRRADIELVEIVNETDWEDVTRTTSVYMAKQAALLPRQIEAQRPDVVLFSSMVTANLTPVLKLRTRVPMVTINHGHDVLLDHPAYQWWVRRVLKRIDGTISVSRATRQATIERGMHPARAFALPNGFDPDNLELPVPREQARAHLQSALGLSLEGKTLLITVGRMVKRKGHQWFIENVMPRLPDHFVYVTVGSGPETEAVVNATSKSYARERIVHLGRAPEALMWQAYSAADLFVMPNIRVPGDMEGFGVVLLEANIARTPAVASKMEGMLDVVTEGQNGHFCTPESADSFVTTLTELGESDLVAFGDTARQHAIDHFGWDAVCDRYVSTLQQIIDG